jgi:hypothetical protein
MTFFHQRQLLHFLQQLHLLSLIRPINQSYYWAPFAKNLFRLTDAVHLLAISENRSKGLAVWLPLRGFPNTTPHPSGEGFHGPHDRFPQYGLEKLQYKRDRAYTVMCCSAQN